MIALRRLYGYLRSYKAWALVAFGSMVIFAMTQTVLAALVQPLFDEVLSRPEARATAGKEPARQGGVRQAVLNTVLNRDRPAGERGAVINTFDRVQNRWLRWWSVRCNTWPVVC